MLEKGHGVLDRGRRLLKVVENLGGSARHKCADRTTKARLEVVFEGCREPYHAIIIRLEAINQDPMS